MRCGRRSPSRMGARSRGISTSTRLPAWRTIRRRSTSSSSRPTTNGSLAWARRRARRSRPPWLRPSSRSPASGSRRFRSAGRTSVGPKSRLPGAMGDQDRQWHGARSAFPRFDGRSRTRFVVRRSRDRNPRPRRCKVPRNPGSLGENYERGRAAAWDPTKPSGLQQQAPLTPEYQAIFEANLASRSSGGQEYNPAIDSLPAGMPRVMVAYDPLEIVVTPEVTYIRSDHLAENRRIYTDGRDWPQTIPPTFAGYSIGKWVGQDGDGRYQALAVESRGMKGPRALDVNGLPLHRDNQTIVRELIVLDHANRDLLHDQI